MLFAADAFDDRRPPPVDPAVAARLADALTSGGDRRIRPGADGRNLYHATVLPTDALAYGSSTISSRGLANWVSLSSSRPSPCARASAATSVVAWMNSTA